MTRPSLLTPVYTTLNALGYTASLGRYLWLEGRYRNGRYHNWDRQISYDPAEFRQPASEREVIDLVKRARKIRVAGAGHSFNTGVVSEGTLVSLDSYTGLVWKDLEKKQVAVRAGTRMRDLNRILAREGLALPLLPSHDAQSLAGLLSTDVHGTGQATGHVSDSVLELKFVNGLGEVIVCRPGDEAYRAAVGGIGGVGILLEAVLQCVSRFNLEQKTTLVDRQYVLDNLERLLEENDHVSLFVFPFTKRCQLNTWNRTDRWPSPLGPFREYLRTRSDALLIAWVGTALAQSRLLPYLAEASLVLRRDSALVLGSAEAFNRTLYHLHEELEVAVPREDTVKAWSELTALYESMYRTEPLPYTILELRFTPGPHDRTLLGPGHGRASTWVDLLVNRADGYERYLEAAAAWIRRIDARPHLGKYVESTDLSELLRVHGENLAVFRRQLERHDPERKFVNPLTARLFYGEDTRITTPCPGP